MQNSNLIITLTKLSANETKIKKYFLNENLGGIPEESLSNEHGIAHRRGFTSHAIQPIPDLRSGLNSPPSSAGSQGRPPFQGQLLFLCGVFVMLCENYFMY